MSELNSLTHGLHLLSLIQRSASLYEEASDSSGSAAAAYQEILGNPQLRNCLMGVPLEYDGGSITVESIEAYYLSPIPLLLFTDRFDHHPLQLY